MTHALGQALHDAAPALLELLVRGALLLAVAAVAARALRGASASLRHLVWASALWSLLLLPVAGELVPAVDVRILPLERESAASGERGTALPAAAVAAPSLLPDDRKLVAESHASAGVLEQPATVATEPTVHAAPLEAAAGSSWSWRSAAAGLWAVGALVLLAEVLRSRRQLRRLSGAAWRIHDPAWWRAAARIGKALGLRRPVLLLATSQTRVPLTWGTRVPIVLLPADAHRWPAERREAVLVHELAHVARGDARGHDIARVAAALFWVNPLVWLALRMMRAERERACDDLVLATGTRASSYAGDLLEIARLVGGRGQMAAAALAMASPSDLEARLRAILDPRVPRRHATKAARLGAASLALTLVLPLAAVHPAQRSSGDAEGAGAPPSARLLDWVPPSAAGLALEPPSAAVPELEPPSVAASELQPPSIAAPELERPRAAVPAFEAPSPLSPDAIGAAQPVEDVETLIAVARAASTLTSDNEKAELLLAVLERSVPNDSLQRTVLGAISTISSSHHRQRVMMAMLSANLVAGSELEFLRTAAAISSGSARAQTFGAFARTGGLRTPAARKEFLNAVASMPGTHEASQLLALLIGRPEFDAGAALDVLPVVARISSSSTKAKLLVAIANRGVTAQADAREAYLDATASLRSPSEIRRVMAAAGLGAEGER
jgi:beta-lactamase regulating signal transducer with metallopeptidase domain